jgi:hypothetical protein
LEAAHYPRQDPLALRKDVGLSGTYRPDAQARAPQKSDHR